MLSSTAEWQEEFIDRPRWPRKNWPEVKDLLLRAARIEISLREEEDHTLIVLKLPVSTKQLSEEFQAFHSQRGVRMEDVFSELLWKKPAKGSSTLWSEFVRMGYSAYRKIWIDLQEEIYVGRSHPEIDKHIREELDKLKNDTARFPGRRQTQEGEQLSLKNRFKELLRNCETIHAIVTACVAQKFSEPAIRKVVYREVQLKRFAKNIFLEHAGVWDKIPYGRQSQAVCLHDPTSWRPNQLAIALLAKERDLKYQTIEKKIAYARKPIHSK
jgi:hypothetical protein